MALRKPLVIVAGQIQQLQAGDTLDAVVAEVDQLQATNAEAVSVSKGQAVYISGAGAVMLARANAVGTSKAMALVAQTTIAAAAVGTYQTDGIISGLAGLTAGAQYWLSAATAGALVSVAPTTVGELVVPIGKALSITEFLIDIEEPILL